MACKESYVIWTYIMCNHNDLVMLTKQKHIHCVDKSTEAPAVLT